MERIQVQLMIRHHQQTHRLISVLYQELLMKLQWQVLVADLAGNQKRDIIFYLIGNRF